jgi:hypothetical protein
MDKKIGVIIPYRNRYNQLQKFKTHIKAYLESKGMPYELITVEQDDAKIFNRGKLLNIGFKYAKKLRCDYVVFHDVDMLPIDADYSYSDVPVHLASNFIATESSQRMVFDEYIGGVTIFPMDLFEYINGYSNDYWGWGFEDNDLLHRCKINGLPLNKKEIKMMGGNHSALKFNGLNSYVKGKNTINFKEEFTIFVSFLPENIKCDQNLREDTFCAFSVPGYDFTISYNSYSRYSLNIFDSRKNIMYVNSDIKPNYKTNISVTVNPKENNLKVFQDGKIIGYKNFNHLYNYSNENNFYLGVGNLQSNDKKWFRGLIDTFAIFDKELHPDEILEISKNEFFGLTQNFGDYVSPNSLKVYYDAKFIKEYKLIDLSGNNNNGEIVNCEIVGYTGEISKIIEMPFRRNCTFKLMEHEENGYFNGGWKEITTRYNQLKYYNELVAGYRDTKIDGLSNLNYSVHSHVKVNNQTHVLVAI